MELNKKVSFKVFLIHPNADEPEIRRFGLEENFPKRYDFFWKKLTEIFPNLFEKCFKVYYKDEDGDEVLVSSDEELAIALALMEVLKVKKFHVRLEDPSNEFSEAENTILHPHIYCDECESNVTGFRYKCLVCKDYDLCGACEKMGLHSEHPMLRIPDPIMFNRNTLFKLADVTKTLTVECGGKSRHHHRRRHSHDGDDADSRKKKRKCGKHETGRETEDEKENGCRDKHCFHRKWKKADKCPYSHLMGDVLNYFNPVHFEPETGREERENEKPSEEPGHVKYLKSMGASLQKLLDPLGVHVNFEIRQRPENSDEKKEESPRPTPSPSASKEVRFQEPERMTETIKEKVEEITKILANQSMNGSKTDGEDTWEMFEEIMKVEGTPEISQSKTPSLETQKDTNFPGPSTTVNSDCHFCSKIPENSNKKEKTETEEKSSECIYPKLNPEQNEDPVVGENLLKMLLMGFSNEGNRLRQLLVEKDGSISQVLDVLSSSKATERKGD